MFEANIYSRSYSMIDIRIIRDTGESSFDPPVIFVVKAWTTSNGGQDQYDIALQAQQKADMDTFLHEVPSPWRQVELSIGKTQKDTH